MRLTYNIKAGQIYNMESITGSAVPPAPSRPQPQQGAYLIRELHAAHFRPFLLIALTPKSLAK